MRGVFISYRREDTGGHAGRLCDRLRQAFGARRVFMDVDGIALGEDFAVAIDQRLAEAGTLIALIGPRWAGDGSPPRIRRDDDLVRLEVAVALRKNVRVIPVLVNGTGLPAVADLTPDVVDLTRRRAFRLDDESFDADAQRLILAIKPRSTSRRAWFVAGAVATVALSGVVVYLARSKPPPPAREAAPAPSAAVASAPAPSPAPEPPAGSSTQKTASAPEPETLKPETPKVKKQPPVALANDGRVRSVNEAPHGERETLPGRYCFHQKSKNLEWTTRGVGFGDLWHGCYASLDTCRQQAREYSRNYGEVVCIEATELWCYYVWERDEKGKETGRPDRCSQRRSLCESDRRWALSRTPTPTPERVGRIAVSGECGLLKDRQ